MRSGSFPRPPPPFFSNQTAPTEIYTLSLHDALPILRRAEGIASLRWFRAEACYAFHVLNAWERSEEHTSELQSRRDLVCRLLLEKQKGLTVVQLCFSVHPVFGVLRLPSEMLQQVFLQ